MRTLLTPTKHLTDARAPLGQDLAAAKSIFGPLDKTPEHGRGCCGIEHVRSALAFENASFAYPRAGRPVLNRITAHVEAWECVVVLGRGDIIGTSHQPELSARAGVDARLHRFQFAAGQVADVRD